MPTLLILQLLSIVEAFGLYGNIVDAASDNDIIFKTSNLNFHITFPCKYIQAIYQENSGTLGDDAVSGQWFQKLQRNAVTLSLGSPCPRDLLNMKPPCAAERSGNTNPN